MTIQMVAARVEIIEKQMATLMVDSNQPTKDTCNKVTKKESKKVSESNEEKPNVKRVSGYILFSKAMRSDAVNHVTGKLDDENTQIKSTDVMKELGRMWKELSDDDKEPWNTQAKEQKETVAAV